MLLACIRAMLDSTASQPSNPAWQDKQHVRAERGGHRTPHRDEESGGKERELSNGRGEMHWHQDWEYKLKT